MANEEFVRLFVLSKSSSGAEMLVSAHLCSFSSISRRSRPRLLVHPAASTLPAGRRERMLSSLRLYLSAAQRLNIRGGIVKLKP